MIYNVDILDTTSRETLVIYVVQGDSARSLQFELKDYTIPTGATVKYYVEKPSGQAVYNSCTVSDNVVTVPLTAQALAETGENKLQVRVEKNSTVITSFTVVLNVKPFGGMNAVQSTTEANVFDQVMAEMLEDIEDAAEDAETYISQSIDATLSITDKAADAKATGDALALKADKSGTEEELTAGTALQLLSDTVTENADPYLYRPTPTGAGDREMGDITGGSVGWNQLVPDTGLSSTYFPMTSGVMSIVNATGTFWGVNMMPDVVNSSGKFKYSDHKYAFLYHYVSGTVGSNPYGFCDASGGTKYFTLGTSDASKVLTGNSVTIAIYATTPSTITDYTNFKFCLIACDLTALLGSTIADYVYTLEQSTAGSGIAWLKSYGYFTESYYAYSAPTMQSVTGLTGHVTVGKNIFDEATMFTGISSTLRYQSIAVHNGTYTMSSTTPLDGGSANLFFFAGQVTSGAATGTNGVSNGVSRTVTVTDGYITVADRILSSVDPRKYRTQINVGSSALSYEPYETPHTYPLDSSVVLRGIVKKDANNKMYYDGDVWHSDGTVDRRYAEVDLGSLSWTYISDAAWNCFRAGITGKAYGAYNFVCSKYDQGVVYNTQTDKCISGNAGNEYLYIRDTAYSDATIFKTAVTGTKLVYELATPTTETATPYQSIQICDPNGTEEYTLASGTAPVPVGGVSKYPADLKAELERVRAAVPAVPASNGTYKLTAVRSNSGVTYSWTT